MIFILPISIIIYHKPIVPHHSSQRQQNVYKVQIKEDDGTITTIETPEIETSTDNGTTITISDSAIKEENTDEYSYISDWGVKIEIGKDYKIAKTAFFPNNDGEYIGTTTINPSQFEKTIETIQNKTSVDSQMPYLTFVERTKNQNFRVFSDVPIEPTYNDGECYYFVFQPSGFAFDGLDGPLLDSFISTNNSFNETVKQSSNYSSI